MPPRTIFITYFFNILQIISIRCHLLSTPSLLQECRDLSLIELLNEKDEIESNYTAIIRKQYSLKCRQRWPLHSLAWNPVTPESFQNSVITVAVY